MKEQNTNNFKDTINYLCNLRLILVNNRMVQDTRPINENVSKLGKIEEQNSEPRDFKEMLNNICNLQFEISNGKVKKIGTQK